MKRAIQIICWVLVAILAIIVLFNFACFVKGNITGEQCPLVFGFGSAVVISGSMEDTIPIYALVVIQEKQEYHIDDIVVFQGNTHCVTHRIVDMQTDESGQVWVTTQGDFNNAPDDPIPYEQLIAKVLFWIPWVGYVQQFLQKPAGFLVLTLVAGVLLMLPDWLKKK